MEFKSFIETQFPVSKISAESYKERKANYSQTLTGLGKWWGRKPLILVRAAILGLLLPSSNNPKRDREIFLKLLTMDDEGLLLRKHKKFTAAETFEKCSDKEKQDWLEIGKDNKPRFKKGISPEQKLDIQKNIFSRLPYNEKLDYCERPEQIAGPSDSAWLEINTYLGTKAKCLSDLIKELGQRQFGRTPIVGDSFCGGGSIPFEAARIGCDAFGSDLNSVAMLLTWASLNIVGGGKQVATDVEAFQKQIYDQVDKQITEWGIEHNEQGQRADAYLYCAEARCPESGWMVPIAPSWVIGEKTKCIAELVPDEKNKRYDLFIKSGVTAAELSKAKASGTVKDSRLVHPKAEHGTPMTALRGDRRSSDGTEFGLRLWNNNDVLPIPSDVFQERLYCIRWVKPDGERYYAAPTAADFTREAKVISLLKGCFSEWQEKGFIPSREIEHGAKTDEPIRTRGWTHWHHLFNPRQLLVNGLLSEQVFANYSNPLKSKAALVALGRCLNFNSRLTRWVSNAANEKGADTFSNQALNTLWVYIARPIPTLGTLINFVNEAQLFGSFKIENVDARTTQTNADIFITDPPYADAINYHELSEYYLSWYEKHFKVLFPEWATDSKRALAVRGDTNSFKESMVQCYQRLSNNMPLNGYQIVMFTHQDASVWADLTLVLWSAGLRVVAAWCIATETDSAMKEGNYVQGTVLLVLKKQTSEETVFLDELFPKVEQEVKNQMDSMVKLDDQNDPNFGDADYQLAAYAAALRVLTQYKSVEDIDIPSELTRTRGRDEVSPVETVIANAVKVACDYLIPKRFDSMTWKTITPQERFYIKGLEVESHGEFRSGVYQELARGFGVKDYAFMLSSDRANQTRLKTATEFASRQLDDGAFGKSPTRHVLFAIREIARLDGDVQAGKNWLKNELKEYWVLRKSLISLTHYFAQTGQFLKEWSSDANAARLLAGALENDHA